MMSGDCHAMIREILAWLDLLASQKGLPFRPRHPVVRDVTFVGGNFPSTEKTQIGEVSS